MKNPCLILASFVAYLIMPCFASAECHHQRNPIGYKNYDICEVEGTGYICVSLEGKKEDGLGGISCFPAPQKFQEESSDQNIQEYGQDYKNSSKNKNEKVNRFTNRGIGEH